MRWRLRKAIEDHGAMEADAARNGSAEVGPAPWWPWAEPEPCGCQWWARPATPGADPEPVWRPCDEHADELWRKVHDLRAEL
jgi:hypothetical protein